MQDFLPGQRCISDAELQMGLGTVLAGDQRTVTVLFLATGETRTYAKLTAPLTRVVFALGESVLSHEGWSLRIGEIKDDQGLITYCGTRDDGSQAELAEGKLDNFIRLNRPTDRLLTGQIDPDKWFELRYQTLRHTNRLATSDLRGLTGGRTSLIPHQLYIAHEVANRYAPRVLLADEVGLGKTIEAGMILHHQLLSERAQRVLVVVPESLLHQWLVEMLRRFNLHFSIFDEERCLAIDASSGHDNPFQTEQLVICNLEFLVNQDARFQQALACDWDLLVVDEAHHLQWSPQQASTEYERIEQLAQKTKGVLLLTATPEQLGKAGHFARLRLLDPDRFPDFDAFLAEEQSYEPIALAVETLLDGHPLDAHVYQTLLDTLPEGDNRQLLETLQDADIGNGAQAAARIELVEHLLDRHGTGRVIFRNTRVAIKGFPARTLHASALPMPREYADGMAAFRAEAAPDLASARLLLCPELLYQSHPVHDQPDWTQLDPRIDWLIARLRQLRPNKVLVITASAASAMDISAALRNKAGMHAALFHEHMSIIERDRSAAFFADLEFGSQVLVCSEIGSEGRNFQFAHHLVLFDLPLNPDLLEQRIGRLDRIGQSETIELHVPYMEGSAQAVMFHWYRSGLDAFEQTCPAGHSVFLKVEEMLVEALHQIDDGIDDLPALIAATRVLHQQMREELHRGRDRLLEYNSCRPHIAHALRDRALLLDAESQVLEYLDAVCECFGIDMEDYRDASYIIRPGAHMQTSNLPGLPAEGMTITADRATALANEDLQLVTWEHPLLVGAMDMILSNELGNTALTAVKYAGAKPGTLLLECLYLIEAAGSEALQSSRYLPPTTVRVVLDADGNNHENGLTHEAIRQLRVTVSPAVARKIVRTYAQELRNMIAAGEQVARRQMPEILATAQARTRQTLMKEIDRLTALRRVNPYVRDTEIRFFEGQYAALTQAIASAHLRLDAQRVIVVT